MDYKTAWKESMQCSDFQNVETDTEFGIFESDTVFRVAFEGSTSKVDWWQNIDFFVKPYKNMSHLFFVHRGFKKKYKSVQSNIIARINEADYKGKAIQIRGYSQGGALAMLCHEDVYFHSGVQPDTMVFGCPRVFSFFNSKLLKTRLSDVQRIENGGDMVTGLPPWWFLFRHQGKKIHIGKKKCFKLLAKDHLEYKENL
jgi:hypothetical protein